MFKITDGKGFQMTFENGITISVQFGGGNYCEHNGEFGVFGHEKESSIWESKNAEVAVWDKNDNWITGEFTENGDGNVVGWVTTDEVFEIMRKIKER